MPVFINTAGYGFEPQVSSVVPQEAGYTYYNVTPTIDASIPPWVIRVINTATGSGIPINGFIYCANAQYATASFGGRQSAPMSTDGKSYGYGGRITSINTTSGNFTDEWTTTACNGQVSSTCSTSYGTNGTAVLWLLRDRTRFNATWNNWGNQPYKNKCSTYTLSANASIAYISCSASSPVTSSGTPANSGSYCAREFQYFTNNTLLTVQNYFSSSCGTY